MTNDKGTLHTSVMTQTDVLLVKCQLVLGFQRYVLLTAQGRLRKKLGRYFADEEMKKEKLK